MGKQPEQHHGNNLSDHRPGGLVESVLPGSAAEAAGIEPDDLVISLDGHPLRDIIDYQFHLEAGRQELDIVREGQQLTIVLEHGVEDPGIVYADAIFDRVATCACSCIFCFVNQLPPGLRSPLYLKDDDYRLSFLYGNFITLNSIAVGDLNRIIAQRLSPLYVSVHTTDTVIRAQMMGVNKRTAARGLDNLRNLGEEGIETHIQVVLCPGINDGAALDKTVRDLDGNYPGVASVGVVPVSLAEERTPLRRVTREDSITVIDAIEGWQEEFRKSRGNGFAYAADEFYLLAGRGLPPVDSYDYFPQYENGVGIAASFLADVEEMMKRIPQAPLQGGTLYLLTGTLAAGVVEDACGRLNEQGAPGLCRPLVVENHLLGSRVTVTGLLGGRDIIAAARAAGLGRRDLLLIPTSCLNNPTDELFLDDLSLAEIKEVLPGIVAKVQL